MPNVEQAFRQQPRSASRYDHRTDARICVNGCKANQSARPVAMVGQVAPTFVARRNWNAFPSAALQFGP